MFKDITLGQYYPSDSPIHKLDPRTKIFMMLLYIVSVFSINNIALFVIPAVYVVVQLIWAGIPLGYIWKSIKPVRWMLLFMAVLNLFLIKTGDPLVDWWIIHITTGGVSQAVYIALRLALLVTGTSIMTLTTTPVELTDGMERLLSPLAKIKIPAHEFAMMMTIALRFIPTLIEEADKISKAQLARGADFETGNIIKRAKNMIPILVPLFISAFRRADELATAMETRCYHGAEGRTKMHVLRFSAKDLIAFALITVMTACIFTVQAIW